MTNQNPTAKDYKWGADRDGLQIGLWPSESSVESGRPVDLRAAVRTGSSDSIEVKPNFTLRVQWGEEIFEYGSGPRPSGVWLLRPGEFLDILGWRFTHPLESDTTTGKFWVVYGSEEAGQLYSGVVEILLQ